MDVLIILLLCILVASATAGVTVVALRRRTAQDLTALKDGLVKIGQGDMTYRLPDEAVSDLSALFTTFNHMVEQLDARLVRQKNEATNQAILDSMPDLIFRFNADGVF
ncbi:MAG: HAMP domain-containing protein, partial [Anaerolineae bacterium]|nr:HAMP domain-containing protein [Anaerolineae bacterium]